MRSLFPLTINLSLCHFVLLSLIVLSTGCAVQLPTRDNAAAKTIEIDHDRAAAIVGQDPWDFFTDVDNPYQCLLSVKKPEGKQQNWVEPETIWQRITIGYAMDHEFTNRRIEAQFNWYKKHPDYMARVSKRAGRYIYYVTEQIAVKNLPMELALLPIVESAYDPFAYSHGRASGIWQFIPGTARHYKVKQNWWYDGRRDIKDSTRAALTYLTHLNKLYKGDWLLALAAYNSGQGTVNRAIRKNKKRGKATDFWSLDLPRETRSYVPKLLALARLIDNPRRYGLTLYPVPNAPYFASVDTQSQIDLAQAAQLADIDIDEIYRLNPGFNRWATAPKGPHRLLVPVDRKAVFEQNLASHPPEQRLHWTRYTVRQGDSLLSLAKRFNTTASLIRQSNNLSGNVIRQGQSLLIAQAAKGHTHYSLSAGQRLHAIMNKRTDNSSEQLFHTVKSGESLWSIAKRYRVKVSKLAKWNGMAPKDTLREGQRLSVWTTPQIKISQQTGPRNGVVRKVGYTVRSGDSLARIAQRFNLRIGDIVKWNAVSTKKYLQPGQLLTLYVDITNAIN